MIYSDASGEGYGGYASYCDTVNANVATDSTYSGNISDTVKVNCEIYSNISDRHTECSEENECGFCDLVIGQNTTNAYVLELDCVNILESDLAPRWGAEALESGVSVRVWSFTHECSSGHQNKAIDAYLNGWMS